VEDTEEKKKVRRIYPNVHFLIDELIPIEIDHLWGLNVRSCNLLNDICNHVSLSIGFG
jgi:hypothetical protein